MDLPRPLPSHAPGLGGTRVASPEPRRFHPQAREEFTRSARAGPGGVRQSMRGLVAVCAEHGPLLRAVFEAAPFAERLERTGADFMGSWDEVVCARSVAQQAAVPVAPADARGLAHGLNAAALIEALGRGQRADAERVLDTLHRIWHGALYGVAPPAPARR